MGGGVADFEVVVVGAGQAGLSAGYQLVKRGLVAERDFLVLDHSPQAGGAWQFRWPSLTLSTANNIHDLPGMSLRSEDEHVPASYCMPRYFAEYEERFALRVHRPVDTAAVRDAAPRLVLDTSEGTHTARGLVNATGTWDQPFIPYVPGIADFAGRQLHTRDYRAADEFAGKHVVVVGGGISAVQHLDEISTVASTTWVTRREPRFAEETFDQNRGREAVALVEERVRKGLPAGSVVSVTGLPLTARVRAARARGVLDRKPMFTRILPDGVQWADGTALKADVILWATGFRSALDHLAPLKLRGPGGGITMTGRLATQVASDPRVHLVGYGPSASTVGANRAGRATVQELLEHLDHPNPRT